MDAAGTGIPIGFNPLWCCKPQAFGFPVASGRVKQNGLLQHQSEHLLDAAVNKSHCPAPAFIVLY